VQGSFVDRRISLSIDGAPPYVQADPGRIEQVLTNLLTNAYKYGTPQTTIEVRIAPETKAVRVSVQNEGPGIPSEDLPGLFERFYRTRQAQSSTIEGLGLGLYISRELIRAHGGRMWVESTPGATTTFSFTLPLDSANT